MKLEHIFRDGTGFSVEYQDGNIRIDEFNEEDHPRAENGQFTSKGNETTKPAKKKTAKEQKAEIESNIRSLSPEKRSDLLKQYGAIFEEQGHNAYGGSQVAKQTARLRDAIYKLSKIDNSEYPGFPQGKGMTFIKGGKPINVGKEDIAELKDTWNAESMCKKLCSLGDYKEIDGDKIVTLNYNGKQTDISLSRIVGVDTKVWDGYTSPAYGRYHSPLRAFYDDMRNQ